MLAHVHMPLQALAWNMFPIYTLAYIALGIFSVHTFSHYSLIIATWQLQVENIILFSGSLFFN